MKIAVNGVGMFLIGHHLVTSSKTFGILGHGIDMKLPEFTKTDADEFEILDLRRWDSRLQATRNVDEVYALTADIGGIQFIFPVIILRSSTITRSINLHILMLRERMNHTRYFYTFLACVYPQHKQTVTTCQR